MKWEDPRVDSLPKKTLPLLIPVFLRGLQGFLPNHLFYY